MPDPPVNRGAIADALSEIGALKFGSFTLASGKLSSYYLDLRTIPSHPQVYSLVVDAYKELIGGIGASGYDAIGGVATAGLTISSPLAFTLRRPMLYVRSESKAHGLGKQVEGIAKPGARVVIVDDLATTGGSMAEAVDALRRNGYAVTYALVLVDRQEGAGKKLGEVGVTLRSYVTVEELIDLLFKSGKVTEEELRKVRAQLRSQKP